MEKTSNPLLQESSLLLHGSHNISTGFGEDSKFLFFSARRPLIRLMRYFHRQHLLCGSEVWRKSPTTGHRNCHSSFPQHFDGLRTRSTPVRSIRETWRKRPTPGWRDRHTSFMDPTTFDGLGVCQYIPTLSLLLYRTPKCMGTFLFFSARFCSHHYRTSVDAHYQLEIRGNLFWRLISTRTVRIIDLHLRPESSGPDRFVPSGLIDFAQYFIVVLVQIQVLCLSALHQLSEFCHYESWTSSFLVESFDAFL